MEYIIFCDESDKVGKFYSNFYGGALVRSKDIDKVNKIIEKKKQKLYLNDEVKWSKVTANYLDKYIELVDCFFELIKRDKIKIRIMFKQNSNVTTKKLKDEHIKSEYTILYYQFFKHSFGFKYCNKSKKSINLKIYFDILPEKVEAVKRFKDFIFNLQNHDDFKKSYLKINREDITEIDSKNHNILQCLDIILGSMSFRLNDKHKEKPIGSRIRGKKTIAKEKLYKHINKHIRSMHKGFNIGASTGLKNNLENRWSYSYSHWNFKSSEFEVDKTKTKNYKSPVVSTLIP